MSYRVVLACLLSAAIIPKTSSKLICYECWTPAHNHTPKYDTWADCKDGTTLRECVGYYKSDECISVAFEDENFELKSCMMAEVYRYKIMCQVEKYHKGRHCNLCDAHFCNKEESKWVPKVAVCLISILNLFLIIF